ncbi:acyltransferase family protein [Granulicella arctica]|uniref:acyltransferase family protein n=1 Tax=Granulicella arctica TaxID=940613 RepID=UPI0021DF76B8|nr:acyltransferase [Granulicella arctica]
MAAPARYFEPVDFRTNFPALGGIRAFALTLIFFVHYGGGFTGGRAVRLLEWVREQCWFSLDLTFVLSGFLITGILYDTQADSHFFKRFFGRRAIRILPIFYLVAIVLLLLTPIVHYRWRWMQLTFLIYIGNFFATSNLSLYVIPSAVHPRASVLISHFWSLYVEEQFYLFWPLIVWWVRDRARVLWIAIGLCAISFIARTIVVYSLHSVVAERWTNHTLPFRLDTILMGGILALLLRGERADQWQRACRWIFLAATMVVMTILLLPSGFGAALTRSVGVLFVAVASAGLVGCTLRAGSVAYRFFGMRPLRYFGRYSYGFFILHILFFEEWIRLRLYLAHKLDSGNLAVVVTFLITFACVFLAAKLSYDLYEVRFLRLKRHFPYDLESAAHKHGYRLK